jgi:hypothetical protein
MYQFNLSILSAVVVDAVASGWARSAAMFTAATCLPVCGGHSRGFSCHFDFMTTKGRRLQHGQVPSTLGMSTRDKDYTIMDDLDEQTAQHKYPTLSRNSMIKNYSNQDEYCNKNY